jgi:TATA-box binding protein (TBP) (component of TFIID and TFIIIB)
MDVFRKLASEMDQELASGLSGLCGTRITTITIGVYMNDGVDLEKLVEEVEHPTNELICSLLTEVMGPMKRSGAKRGFSNCVVFKIPGEGKLQQAVKVFCNGSIHVTGYKSILKAFEVCEIFAVLFDLIEGGNGIDERYVIKKLDVQLVNICFVHPLVLKGMKINLHKLYDIIKKLNQYYVTFDTDRYAGVVIKAPKYTVMVFESGSIIITSVTKFADIREAYFYIDDIFIKHITSFLSRGNEVIEKHFFVLK